MANQHITQSVQAGADTGSGCTPVTGFLQWPIPKEQGKDTVTPVYLQTGVLMGGSSHTSTLSTWTDGPPDSAREGLAVPAG